MKKLIVILVFLVATFAIYTTMFSKEENTDTHVYTFDFDHMDKDMWYVGQWGTLNPAYNWMTLAGDSLKMTGDGDNSAYLVTKPIEIRDGDVITLKRHVKMTHGEIRFAGGIAMYQTDENTLIPEDTDGAWHTAYGDGVALIEYSYDLSPNQERPGKDVIRFLAADWEYNDNYQLINPIYNEWFDETLEFDTRSNQLSYTINGTTYRLNSYKLDGSNIRFMFHAFGDGTGNSVEMDQLEITVENKRNKRLN